MTRAEGRGQEGGSGKLRTAMWAAYAALLVLSIPWYFPAGSGEPLVLGFPLWCLVSLGCYVLVALLTVWRLDALWEAEAGAVKEREEP